MKNPIHYVLYKVTLVVTVESVSNSLSCLYYLTKPAYTATPYGVAVAGKGASPLEPLS